MYSKAHSIHTFTASNQATSEIFAGDMRIFVLLLVFAFLFFLEARAGYRRESGKTVRQSYLTNLSIFVLNDVLISMLSVSSLILVAERFSRWGLLSLMKSSAWKALLIFLLLDLTLYLWHRANHHFDWLWMFHKVHHNDRCMNVSTAFRLHFVEVLMTTLVKALFIVVVGVETASIVLSETIITLLVMFHHANISFTGVPWLGRLLIVPALHRTHHSVIRAEHDSNYGAVFSWWDHIFDTIKVAEVQDIGLKDVKAMNVFELLKFGFCLHYSEAIPVPNPQSIKQMIAEAAYYRAARRGFATRDEFRDWLEAEQEILARFRLQCQ